jgi:nicotinic acid mononucleotide adenylyltransferase
MRFLEFQNNLQSFQATVKVKNDSGTMTIRTMVSAESMAQAQFMMRHIFGKDAVNSMSQLHMHEEMTEETKTLSPQELQTKSLADQAKRLNQQAKQLKARQQMAKAQSKLRQASEASTQVVV